MIFRVPSHPNSSFILCILGRMWSECASMFSYHIFLLGEGSLILQHATACSRDTRGSWTLQLVAFHPQKQECIFWCLWHFFIINYVFVSLTHGFSSKDIPVACEDKLYCTRPHHISALLMRKGKRVLFVLTCGCQTRGWGGGGIFPPGRPRFLTKQVCLQLVPSTGCPCAGAPVATNGLRRMWVTFRDKTFLFQNLGVGAAWFRVGSSAAGSVPAELCPCSSKGLRAVSAAGGISLLCQLLPHPNLS